MAKSIVSRRGFMTWCGLTMLLPRTALAGDPVDLTWDDLLPEGSAPFSPDLRGIVPHEAADLARQQPLSSGVRTDWNGRIVRIPGFVVPIRHEGTGVVAFILVPYVGACIHVPPPPANQLVLVTTERPYEVRDLFEPVRVTGLLETAATSTELADIGYTLSADRIEAHAL